MKYYVGLDVSNKDTSICIMDSEGIIVKEAKVLSDPDNIDKFLKKTKLSFEKIGLEAGAFSHWLVTGLKAFEWNAICIDSRTMAALISVNVNKTDRNDARVIANAMRCNNYKEVHIKSAENRRTDLLLASRAALLKQKTQTRNVIRGLLKTYGIKLSCGASTPVRELIKDAIAFEAFEPPELKKLGDEVDWSIIESLLVVSEKIQTELDKLDEKLASIAKADQICQRFMTVDGVGPVTALTFKAVIDDPHRFKKSRSVGAYLGMTPTQYSSGETVKQGRVSKCGPKELRTLLHEAGRNVITICKKPSKLKSWGMKKKTKLKTQKAGMAVGRKIGVILHRMWVTEKDFDRQLTADEALKEQIKVEEQKEKKLLANAKKQLKKEKVA